MWRSRARSAARGVTSAFSLMRKAVPMLTPRTSFSVISGLSVRSAIGEPMIPDDNWFVFRDVPWKTVAAAAGILTIAIGFAYHVAGHPMDFRVYHYGARGVFDGTRPVYGPASGIGWPMHYRYPPLFLPLLAPFAAMPLAWAAGLWVVLKIFVLVALVRSIVERTGAVPRPPSFVIPLLFITPYLIEEFRYGNAQFFVFALTAAALLMNRERPVLAAGSLALAISIKVWPLFFVPYLAVRRGWEVRGYAPSLVVWL